MSDRPDYDAELLRMIRHEARNAVQASVTGVLFDQEERVKKLVSDNEDRTRRSVDQLRSDLEKYIDHTIRTMAQIISEKNRDAVFERMGLNWQDRDQVNALGDVLTELIRRERAGPFWRGKTFGGLVVAFFTALFGLLAGIVAGHLPWSQK